MDLSKVPTEDLQAIKEGRWSDVSTPGLQEYQSQRQHQTQAVEQSQNPQTTPDAAGKASIGGKPYMSPGESVSNNYWSNVKARITDPERAKAMLIGQGPAKTNAIGDDLGAANLAIPAEAAPAALQKLSAYLGGSGAGPALSRVAANTGLGAVQGAYNHPEDLSGGATTGAMVGGGLSTAGELAGPALGKSADWLQQKAMGLNKYISGVGSEAIDQGIRGTKGAMAGQVEDSLQDLGDHAGEAIGKLGRIDSSEAAKPLQDYASGLKVKDIVPEHSTSDYQNAVIRGQGISGRGEVDAGDAWQLAKKAGQAGYRNQKALQSEAAMLAQLEQQGYSNAIKDAYYKANPGATNEVADTFAKMSKLYKAQGALNAPENISKGIPLSKMLLGSAGMATHGPIGAAAGLATDAAVRSPLLQSYGAAGLDASGAGTKAATTPGALQAIIQSLFSNQDAK